MEGKVVKARHSHRLTLSKALVLGVGGLLWMIWLFSK